MKEKNLNNSQPAQDQNQDNYNTGHQSGEDARDDNHDTSDQQGSYSDEYDNYAPWG